MIVLLISLSVLFLASILFFVLLRLVGAAEPPRIPPIPAGLWLSTALLLLSSATMHAALRGIRSGSTTQLSVSILLTTAMGIAFLISQTRSWFEMLPAVAHDSTRLYAGGFFVLTGLHAAHVLGGLIPLGVVAWRSLLGRYSPSNYAGVRNCGMYWHFLDAVWLVLFSVLLGAAVLGGNST